MDREAQEPPRSETVLGERDIAFVQHQRRAPGTECRVKPRSQVREFRRAEQEGLVLSKSCRVVQCSSGECAHCVACLALCFYESMRCAGLRLSQRGQRGSATPPQVLPGVLPDSEVPELPALGRSHSVADLFSRADHFPYGFKISCDGEAHD
ncbi:hypothetical protein PLANTIT3_30167 [Plantibacter sp. T3]|nr:hypothetical protein PLANTIT3_30167 [Plantibacter sp. T3]